MIAVSAKLLISCYFKPIWPEQLAWGSEELHLDIEWIERGSRQTSAVLKQGYFWCERSACARTVSVRGQALKLYDPQLIFWAVEVSFCTFIQLYQSIKYQTQSFSLDLSISFISITDPNLT